MCRLGRLRGLLSIQGKRTCAYGSGDCSTALALTDGSPACAAGEAAANGSGTAALCNGPLSDADRKRLREYWRKLPRDRKTDLLSLSCQQVGCRRCRNAAVCLRVESQRLCVCACVQLLDSACLFAPWLTFRLYLRVIMNNIDSPFAAALEAAVLSYPSASSTSPALPLGDVLVANPTVSAVNDMCDRACVPVCLCACARADRECSLCRCRSRRSERSRTRT